MDALVYIIGAVILVVLIIIFVFYDYINDYFVHLFGPRRFKRKIKKFARQHDYLMLTNVTVKTVDNKYGSIPILLFADKYIYVITSKTIFGAISTISGKGEDEKWIHEHKEKRFILNPIKENRKLIQGLVSQMGINSDDFVNIVVYAKTCLVDDISFEHHLEVALEERNLIKYLKKMEKSREINDFNQDKIDELVNKVKNLVAFNEKNKNKFN